MKTIILLTASLIVFASCKKTYTCTCPYNMPPAANISFGIKAKNNSDAVIVCSRMSDDSCTVSKK